MWEIASKVLYSDVLLITSHPKASYLDLDENDDGIRTETCILQKYSLIGMLKVRKHTHTHKLISAEYKIFKECISWLTSNCRFFGFKTNAHRYKRYWRSLLFYLRVITEKSDVDGKGAQSKEPEEITTIKETVRVVPWSSKEMVFQQ